MKKEKKYLIYGIGIVLIVLIGVTFAYFTAQIIGDRKEISVTIADLKVIFTNGESITGEEIEPGWSITKTFSVENKTKGTYKYNIVIEDLINTFKTKGFLVYKITSTNDGYNMTDYKDVPKSAVATDTVLVYSVEIPVGVKQEYTIEIKYINSETEDQSIDMGSTLSGNLYITEGTLLPTLYEKILADNGTILTRSDFSTPFTTTNTGTFYQATETVGDSTATVYYFAGDAKNNWVYFGEFYWRIIRTNEDGSVRLLYAGTSPDTTEGYIGTSEYNTTRNDPMYVGYMYGTSGSLASNRTNTNDSTIKQTIDTWYENNLLTDYDKYISREAVYCNDRSIINGTYSTSSSFVYAPTTRLDTNKTPTYNCSDINDMFTTNDSTVGNKKLTYPIGLMTADEVAYAGGVAYTTLESPHAWYYTNAKGESIVGSGFWWTMAPNRWSGSNSFVWVVYGSGSPGSLYGNRVDYSGAVRASVSLKSCNLISKGDGRASNPYEIYYGESCTE